MPGTPPPPPAPAPLPGSFEEVRANFVEHTALMAARNHERAHASGCPEKKRLAAFWIALHHFARAQVR